METKLTAITPSYHSFVPDQILTAGQLNEFLNYFDDQDRLSRIFLSGTGLVCGFKVSYGTNPADPDTYRKVTITQGAAVTTDGDLLNLEIPVPDSSLENIDIPFVRYTNYRTFSDENAVYKPFFWKPAIGGDTQINLLELIPEGEANGEPLISSLSQADLDDKVVLLYLDNYEEDPDACTGINCENQGINNIRKLRVLLVSQADANYILSCDPMFNSHYLIQTYLNLEEVTVQRVTVNATNSQTFSALRSSYINAIQAENVVDKLRSGFTTMLQKLGMNTEATNIDAKLTALLGINATMPMMYFQYRYDLLRDIADAYNELKDIFLCSVGECCPDIHSFPKHIMLGRLIQTADDRFLHSFRHEFYESPITRCKEACPARFKHYVKRTIEMLNEFIATEIPMGAIRITPSLYRGDLSGKAIPFYYNLQLPLLNWWNFEKYKVNKQRRNLSYHTTLLDPSGAIQHPLKYNLEPYNFLRIENIQGKDFRTALEDVDRIKVDNGLAFDVKALGINISSTETINIDDYECEFEDLNLMLDAWTQEHECILGKISYYFSAFSTVVPGYNYHLENYYYPVETQFFESSPVKGPNHNVVIEKAYDKTEALGGLFVDKAIKFRGCSGSDLAVQIDQAITRLPLSKPNVGMVDATLKIPGKLLGYAYVLMDKRPIHLRDITPGLLDTIAATAESLCSTARDGITKYNRVIENEKIVMMLMSLSFEIATLCCSAEKLKLIYDEIEKRKQEILLGLNLAKFREQHTGMEHFAGTEPGGTFIMVYVQTAVGNIPAKTVVADFSLPYLCCSDCKSVNFIMPRMPASLRLSSNNFCIGTSTSPVELYAYPPDGTVKFEPAVPGITVNGNQLLIDSSIIPESMFGTTIHFTVNDQVTDATLTIYESPEFTIVRPDNPLSSGAVQFGVSFPPGVEDPGMQYLWRFGDGSTSTLKSPLHNYSLPLPGGNTITVYLTVTPANGACPVTKDVQLFFEDVSITLSESTFCSNNMTRYPFSITPAGATVNITGRGVDLIGGIYYFTPSRSGLGLITIYNNGVPVKLITVNPIPTARVIASSSEDDKLILTSDLQHADSFVWKFTHNGEIVHEPITGSDELSIPYEEFDVEPGETIDILLEATNECTTVPFRARIVRPNSFALCSAGSQSNIGELYSTFLTLAEEGSFSPVAQVIVNDIKQLYNDVIDDYPDYLSGSLNYAFGSKMSELIYRLFMEIQTVTMTGEEDNSILVKMYFNLMQFGLTVIRCQSEENFLQENISNMIALLKNELNPSSSDSLQGLGIDVNPDRENSDFLETILALRPVPSTSWNEVNDLLTFVLG